MSTMPLVEREDKAIWQGDGGARDAGSSPGSKVRQLTTPAGLVDFA
jgi:hypothetical protein